MTYHRLFQQQSDEHVLLTKELSIDEEMEGTLDTERDAQYIKECTTSVVVRCYISNNAHGITWSNLEIYLYTLVSQMR